MDTMSEFQLSHREAIEKMIATDEYNQLGHRETVEQMLLGANPEVGVLKPEVVAKPEVWTQPIGERWPPGQYGVSARGETPAVIHWR